MFQTLMSVSLVKPKENFYIVVYCIVFSLNTNGVYHEHDMCGALTQYVRNISTSAEKNKKRI